MTRYCPVCRKYWQGWKSNLGGHLKCVFPRDQRRRLLERYEARPRPGVREFAAELHLEYNIIKAILSIAMDERLADEVAARRAA